MPLPPLPPFGSIFASTPVGGLKIPQIVDLARPFVKVDKKELDTAIKVITTVESAIDVKGKTAGEVVKETEDRLGIKLSKSQIESIKVKYPASGLKAVVTPEEKGSVSFSHTSFGHVRKWLEAL